MSFQISLGSIANENGRSRKVNVQRNNQANAMIGREDKEIATGHGG
jgi:hypothetical protein